MNMLTFVLMIICQSPITDKQIDSYLLAAAQTPDKNLIEYETRLREIDRAVPKTSRERAKLKKEKKNIEGQIEGYKKNPVIQSPVMQLPIKPGNCGHIKLDSWVGLGVKSGVVENKVGTNLYVVDRKSVV